MHCGDSKQEYPERMPSSRLRECPTTTSTLHYDMNSPASLSELATEVDDCYCILQLVKRSRFRLRRRRRRSSGWYSNHDRLVLEPRPAARAHSENSVFGDTLEPSSTLPCDIQVRSAAILSVTGLHRSSRRQRISVIVLLLYSPSPQALHVNTTSPVCFSEPEAG